MIASGSQLGPYKIISPLGAGGMGEVYRARDSRLGRDVAVKVLPERLAKDIEALSRFEREVRALASLSHPNILIIHDFNADHGVHFAVTELLEGETLRVRIQRGVLSPEEAVTVASAIAEGLSAAHSKGVIHRDLKPDNIFLTTDSVVKILDFGLAFIERAPSPEEQDHISTMWAKATTPGTIMGTIPYMSPEQVRGETVDARSDIFSFGCVLHEMLTGRSPFNKNNMAETMAAILTDQPELTRSGREVPQELKWVVLCCLEKDPQDRFQSARDLASALRMASSGSKISKSIFEKSRKQTKRKSRKSIASLAVLPFSNAGDDADAEYLSDGIAESIINNLSQLPKLRVMARSTVFRYKGQAIDPQQVGSELNVDAVLTGRVVQRGDTLVIKAEMAHASDGSQIWGEQYNRKLSDILAIEEEIAQQISEKLRVKLTGEEKQRLSKRHTGDSKAYQLYLKGRYCWNKRGAADIDKALVYFQQAIDADPGYALAYAGLADCYILLGGYGWLYKPKEAFMKAKAAASKALELDGDLAEARTSLAMIKVKYDWDWEGAEKEFKLAIELSPKYPTAHQWYSRYLQAMGRFDEAVEEAMLALELDPLSLIINSNLGYCHYLAGRWDEAIAQFNKTLELDPNFVPTHMDLAFVYGQKGMFRESFEEFQKATGPFLPKELMAAVDEAYAESGYEAGLQVMLSKYKESATHGYVSPYVIAILYSRLGENDNAFEWLEKAYEDRSEGLAWLKVDLRLERLHSDPRYADLMRRIGLQ